MTSEAEPPDSKLAGAEELNVLLPEPGDSGIDSDEDPRRSPRPPVSDSSDVDLIERARWEKTLRMNCDGKALVAVYDKVPDVEIRPHWHNSKDNISSDSSSSSLSEIELTASEEDEDGSVLELVIPIKSSKYQRVPTSSPRKGVIKHRRSCFSVICCFPE